MFGFIERLWHTYVRRHLIVFHAATKPDDVWRDDKGKLLIQVFEQVEFAVPIAHYECTTCGTIWAA